MATTKELIAALEPLAANSTIDVLNERGMDALCLVSIGISLKRIADAHDRMLEGHDVENLAHMAGMAFQRGINREK